jgi:NADH:ubiquinone oxidoreductase subunit C
MTDALKITDYLNKTLPGAVIASRKAHDQEVIEVPAAKLRDVVAIFKKELGLDMLLDVVAIDWSKWVEKKPLRFEVDYFFYGVESGERAQLKVAVENDADPRMTSITDLYPAANWCERECFDMMGIRFDGHPNLKRLLMWNEFIGHPLRKDYPLNRRQPLPVNEKLV